MSGLEVKAVVEVVCNKPQAVYLITMSAGSSQVKCIFEAGEIRRVFGSDFPGHLSVLSCSDESWIVVPETFCPLGLEVSMKVAGETVGDPSGLSFCIDIEHPWKDYFPIIGQVLEYLSIDPLRCEKTGKPYRREPACFAGPVLILMEQRRALLMEAHLEALRRAILIEPEQSLSDDIVPYGVIGGRRSPGWKSVMESFCPWRISSFLTIGEEHVDRAQLMTDNISFLTHALASERTQKELMGRNSSSYYGSLLRLAVKKLEEEELRGTNGYLFPDVVTEDPASLQMGIRDLSPVVNADTATEARMGALGLLDNSLNTSRMSRIANAWKMHFPRPSEVSEEDHHWIKEVVGMGVMGMSASAGYGTQSVVAKAICALAFASSATAFWLPRNWMTTIRVLNKVGAVACIAGILAAIGHDLPHEYKWWVAAAAFLPPAAAVVVA